MKSMTDSTIVELYVKRDESAISESARKYGAYLRQIAGNILGSVQDSEEVTNDTYMSAWNSIPPHHPEKLSTYLGKIARQIAIDMFRKRTAGKRGTQYALSLSELEDCIPFAGAGNPAQETEARLLRELINDWLGMLSQDARGVFLGRYFYHDSVKTVASNYNMSESKVKSILFRARNSLKQHLENEGFSV